MVLDKLASNSIRPIIVGGFVRDSILNIASKDTDVELYGVKSFEQLEEILEEFGEVNNVGKCFGVCKLSLPNLEIDFTLPRVDNKISEGHCGFEVDINKNLDFKTATSRRDFTINAIGYDVIDKKILDPFKGQDDLKNKILRAVDIKTFAQDPLRVLRAVQFYARLHLSIDDDLLSLCKDICKKNILYQLPSQRIYDEIKKLLLKSTKPSLGFLLLKNIDALKYITPLNKLSDDNFHTILPAIDKMATLKIKSKSANITLFLAILCHKFNDDETQEFIINLTDEKKLLKNVLSIKKSVFKTSYNNSQLLRLATQVNIEHFLIYNNAISSSYRNEIFTELHLRAKELGILNKKAPALLQGRDILALGIQPSELYSKILFDAYEAQIDLKIISYQESIEWLKRYLKA